MSDRTADPDARLVDLLPAGLIRARAAVNRHIDTTSRRIADWPAADDPVAAGAAIDLADLRITRRRGGTHRGGFDVFSLTADRPIGSCGFRRLRWRRRAVSIVALGPLRTSVFTDGRRVVIRDPAGRVTLGSLRLTQRGGRIVTELDDGPAEVRIAVGRRTGVVTGGIGFGNDDRADVVVRYEPDSDAYSVRDALLGPFRRGSRPNGVGRADRITLASLTLTPERACVTMGIWAHMRTCVMPRVAGASVDRGSFDPGSGGPADGGGF